MFGINNQTIKNPMIKTVLLVDDDPMSLLITKEVIKNESFSTEVIIAMNGLLALKEIEKFFDQKQHDDMIHVPHIIFLDIEMPLMNGWEFLDHYTRCFSEKLPDTAIIILTGSIDDVDYQKAKKYPAVTKIMRKPMLGDKINYLKKNNNLQQYFA